MNASNSTLALALCCSAFLSLPGCSSSQKSSSMAAYSIEPHDSLIGKWKSTRGDLYTFTRTSGNDLRIDVLRGDNLPASPLKARVINIDNVSMLEVDFSGAPSQGTTPVPVYAYARVESKDNTLSYSPLSTAWLKNTVAGNPDITFSSAASIDPKAGGVVVRSPKAMAEILSRASKDPSAFITPELMTRIN